jgi:thiamine biosynthesis lipoprotein
MILVRNSLLIALLFTFLSCNKEEECPSFSFDGKTMGTTYTVKGCLSKENPKSDQLVLKIETERVLKRINKLMSTYISDSEIMKFNRGPKEKWYIISKETAEVLHIAEKISALSGGAYDVTVGPIVNLWGFGPKKTKIVPKVEDIKKVLQYVGYKNLLLKMNPLRIIKKHELLQIDLSSIAKGYAVDRVSRALEKQKIHHYMVEIGGEIRTRGINIKGHRWSVGIEAPVSGRRMVQKIIKIDNFSMATSGDYRNYFEESGKRYSHTIDPRTGYPISHNLASVTVLTKNCGEADGFATMFLVLGIKDGMKIANDNKIAAYFITKEDDRFKAWPSKRFMELFLKGEK